MTLSPRCPVSNVNKSAGHGSRGGHHWADEMSSSALSLAALKISIRRATRSVPPGIRISDSSRDTWASGFAPLKTGGLENPVQPFGLSLNFTGVEPGTTIARTFGSTERPRTTLAAEPNLRFENSCKSR